MAEVPKLLTLTQFSARHPAFSVGSLRWLRFRSEPVRRRRRSKDGDAVEEDLPANGFGPAFVVVGGRVLVDEQRFFEIVQLQNDKG